MQGIIYRDRERKVVDIVKSFLRSAVFYRQLYKNYQRNSLKFDDLQKLVDDRGGSLLFNLKKDCHALFRGNDASMEEEKLFDLAISSIFHEAMIIRENCYQLEVYRPKVVLLEKKSQKTVHEGRLLKELNRALSKANKRLSQELKETHDLVNDALEQLRELLKSYAKNGLLIRFLLENEGLVEEAYGQGGLKNIFSSIYKEGWLEALLIAGASYCKSGYYEKASETTKKALALRYSDDIRFLHLFYSGLRDYYDGNLSKALENLKAAKELGKNLPNMEEYLEKMESIFNTIMVAQKGIQLGQESSSSLL
jgi:tetratricopeptide (TPR) repeat protein